ncbi:MAG: DNA polymerase III subunit beta [Spirochaetes bacterium]|nr:MAG: DNA polymerase III subunit beta [Spirochaetota bacterium]
MKFLCEKNNLLKEITIAYDIIASRNVLSILSNVLLEAGDGILTVRATDLKVGFESRIPVEVIEPGKTTVFCDKMLGILRSLPEEEIEFAEVENNLLIHPKNSMRIDFKLRCVSPDNFPELKETPEENFFKLPQIDFIEMINQTIFAVSEDESRYFMNGVYMEKKDNGLVMVATDGRRLSYINKSFESKIKEFKGIIIPPKILNLAKRLLPGEGEVSVAITEKSLFLNFNSIKISSNLIDGQFPNYNKVIQGEQPNRIVISRTELMEALRRVSLFVEQKAKRIYMTISENTVVLNSEESEIGTAREELSCNFEGTETTLALNYLYLEEPLKVMEEDEVTITFSAPDKAVTIYPVPEKDFFHIVMPMQL